MAIHVVLLEPEIPQNTGNISRTCVVTGSELHIIGPMGFSLDEKHVKRAGLDYWKDLKLHMYDSLEEFYQQNPEAECWYFSSKVSRNFNEASYSGDCYLMFGKETQGLPKQLLDQHTEHTVRIPMQAKQRCLNLSNAVCVGVYEALRQNDYFHMK
ncbi:tRNA (cytidine(34)-2'-O)-methyltransferase [Christensenella timonensis]|uniref:tRNA (cytidine(34)-2'-O)-methyltransferase n=1 Tax=Christensenella timonensis TaxID=1816678 RepID=UPI00082BF907|nr:tRNA (cytidine(34)-2'-O)-methyltransferase [Christensenella timonensis]